MKSKIENILNLNTTLSGNDFDNLILEILKENIKFISTDEWKDKSYSNFRKEISKENFNISDQFPYNEAIIDKPNGSQRWPDLLYIKDNKFYPIEIKSGNGDKIMWNSSLPKYDCLYIFNNYKKKDVTIFLGQHIIDDENISLLEEYVTELKSLASKYKGLTFGAYGRVAYETTQKYTSNPNRSLRETEAINFIWTKN